MTTEDILSGVSLVASLAAVVLGLRRHDAKKHEAKLTARAAQGQRYAQLAVAHAAQMPQADRLQAALEAFRLADTALDGRRDFTDAQARVFIEAEVSARKSKP